MRFGTDGVRGVANSELTVEFAVSLGRAAARVLGGEKFLIGRDTRRSGTMLEAALAAGICAEGLSVEMLGVLPTPAVATLSALDGHPAAMISASHNPFADNGIKLFAAGGRKLSDAVQRRLEAEIERLASAGAGGDAPTGPGVGVISHVEGSATARYEASVLDALEGRTLDGLSVALDCANGANTDLAAEVFARAGATVSVMGDRPNGVNINDGCGSTHPEGLQAAVVGSGADLGFAFDGDADRVLAVDARGELVDGDQLIAVCAIDLRARGLLRGDAVVVTVMSNLGFRTGMAAAGIEVVETAVGDRYVLEALDEGNFSLGGEQSGHLIFSDLTTTGDGLLSALIVADIVKRSGRALADLTADAMQRLPQVLQNVRLTDRPADLLDRIAPEVAAVEAELGDTGRLLIRPSGTEPLIRVMIEAPDPDLAQRLTTSVCDALVAAAAR